MNTFDISTVEKNTEVIAAQKDAGDFLVNAEKFVVTEDTETQAKTMRTRAKESIKENEAKRQGFIGGAESFVKMVKGIFSPTIKAYEEGDKILKEKLEALARKRIADAQAENKRREAEAEKERVAIICRDIRALVKQIGADESKVLEWLGKNRDIKITDFETKTLSVFNEYQLEAIKQRLLERAKKESPEAEKTIERIESRPEQVEVVKVPVKVAGVRMIKKVRVIDESLIPKKYWVIDRVELDRVVKMGIEVPGAELYEDPVSV